MCCESQLSFKKQTPNIFEDNILLPLNQTLHYPLSIFVNQVWTTTLYMKESKYPLPSWTTVWSRFLRPLVLHRKKAGVDQRIATGEEQCAKTYISNAKTNGRYAKAAEPSLPCIIDLWNPCTTLKHFLRCTITSIASNFHLTWPKIHGWLHRDRGLLNLISFTGKNAIKSCKQKWTQPAQNCPFLIKVKRIVYNLSSCIPLDWNMPHFPCVPSTSGSILQALKLEGCNQDCCRLFKTYGRAFYHA